ncbi:hypothetical protein ACFLU6_14870, partial [Acidobacteriota bacterium]
LIYGATSGDFTPTTGDSRQIAVGDVTGDGRPDLVMGIILGDGRLNLREDSGEAILLVSKGNRPPRADAGTDIHVPCDTVGGAEVTLDGSLSSDPDGDSLVYFWDTDGDGDFTDVPGSATGAAPTLTFPVGSTVVALVVRDGQAESTPDALTVTVETVAPSGTVGNALIARRSNDDVVLTWEEGRCTPPWYNVHQSEQRASMDNRSFSAPAINSAIVTSEHYMDLSAAADQGRPLLFYEVYPADCAGVSIISQ